MTTCTTRQAVLEDVDDCRLLCLISAETLDRSSEVLLAEGAELEQFRRNPVLLWAHQADLPPIGRAVAVEAEAGRGVWALNEFAPTPFAQEILGLYRGGYLNAFSVGFRPLELDRRAVAEGQRGATVTRWELVEQSAVAVPANPDALAVAARDGSRAADWLLKTYYAPDDEALLALLGLPPEPSWPELAAGTARFFGLRGGVTLSPGERQRLERRLRGYYLAIGRRFPDAADPASPDPQSTVFWHDETELFEEREIAALAQLLRGRSEALRNIARKRRRRGQPLPEVDPVREAAANLAEALDGPDRAGAAPGGAPSSAPAGAPTASDEAEAGRTASVPAEALASLADGEVAHALADLRDELVALRRARTDAVAQALEDLRRRAIGGR